ncbi:MAG: hypothetical protein H7211_15730 [Aquabacterium sp.]|nr:hypothetical protein [Ferruginibacter sp.]
MKKYILSFTILVAMAACNQPAPSPVATPLPPIQTPPPVAKDTIKTVTPPTLFGTGLTLEEIKDDSTFTDGSIPTSWAVAGFTDVKGFKLFLKQLQQLVLGNSKEQIATMIRYPLGRSIKGEKEFIKNYDRLFTKDVKLSVAAINFSEIFRNSKGAMTENGRVWFSQGENGFKIIAVNN